MPAEIVSAVTPGVYKSACLRSLPAVDLFFPDELARTVSHHAQRLDRSVGWVIRRSWVECSDQVTALEPRSPTVAEIKANSLSRNPIVYAALQLHLGPDSTGAPTGLTRVTVFSRGLAREVDAVAARLGLASWELLQWTVERSLRGIEALPSVDPPGSH